MTDTSWYKSKPTLVSQLIPAILFMIRLDVSLQRDSKEEMSGSHKHLKSLKAAEVYGDDFYSWQTM